MQKIILFFITNFANVTERKIRFKFQEFYQKIDCSYIKENVYIQSFTNKRKKLNN